MKKYDWRIKNIIMAVVIFIAIHLMMFFCCTIAQGQNVVRKGNTFIEQPTDTVSKPKAKETNYVFVEKDGQAYPIWVSSKGKYFIIKVSKRTGKEYRKYLPKLTKILTEK